MRVAKSGHKIENEIGHSIDLGSFLVFLSLVTMSHEVKNEVGMCLALNLIHYEWSQVSLSPYTSFSFMSHHDLSG